MQIIPAIDVLEGKVVRLQQGDFDRVTDYGNDPLKIASAYATAGAKRLHLVNLSGAKDQNLSGNFLELLRELRVSTDMKIQVGGGMRSLKDIQSVLDAGADAVVIGTMLFENQEAARAAVTLFGADRIIAALDVEGDEVKIRGWKTGSGVTLGDACRQVQDIGIRQILVTDITRDGMGEGVNAALYRRIKKNFPGLQLLGSGGVSTVEDVRAAAESGCDGLVIGKALLSGTLILSETLASDLSSLPTEAPAGAKVGQPSLPSYLAVRVIPCLDVDDGRVVKGIGFQNLRDAGDPVELAKRYCREGADELVFLDISATHRSRSTLVDLVRRVADAVNIPFTVGGGVRSVDDARALLCAGADKVAVNSAAVQNPSLLSEIANELGSANTVCAIDARKVGDSWIVLTRGGRENTGMDAIAWATEAVERGAGELLVTSFDRDGTGEGFDTELLTQIKQVVRIPVIASGGAGSLQSIVDAVKVGKADAILAASIFHFGTFSIGDVKRALQQASFPVRL
ncbi:MAG: imidazole glycerol phosphate synthase subunit HisF [Candidatus Peribacteraceae bacterium]|nr:imidazole glycerol phosphate synthase subunit HisF [Candidatus Peribacteraceae bacterium]